MPKTTLGKLSFVLILLCPVLFLVGRLFLNLYESIPAGDTILEDIANRPGVSISMLTGMLSGVMAGIAGAIAVFIYKERSLFVYLATAAGGLLLLFLLGEFFFPH